MSLYLSGLRPQQRRSGPRGRWFLMESIPVLNFESRRLIKRDYEVWLLIFERDLRREDIRVHSRKATYRDFSYAELAGEIGAFVHPGWRGQIR